MNIECKISNETYCYNSININNFYQVLFVDDNFNTIIIYTGIIVNGKKEQETQSMIDNQFHLKIEFISNDATIQIINKSFFSNAEPIKKVWGEKSVFLSSPMEITDKLNSSYGEDKKNITIANSLLKKGNILYIEPDSKQTCSVNVVVNVNETIDTENKAEYIIKPDFTDIDIDYFYGGILTWTKTTITFKKQIDDSFSYKLTKGKDTDDIINYNISDFSVYYVAPLNYTFCNYSMEYNNGKDKENKITNEPSILRQMPTPKDSKHTYFNEWITDMKIQKKIYYKLEHSSAKYFNTFEINFLLESKVKDEINNTIKGVLIACLFSFGMHSANIDKMSSFLLLTGVIPVDILWFIICFCLILSFFVKSNSTLSKKMEIIRIVFRGFSYFLLIAWGVLVFSIDPILEKSLDCLFIRSIPIMSIVSLILNFFLIFKKHYDFTVFKIFKNVLKNI